MYIHQLFEETYLLYRFLEKEKRHVLKRIEKYMGENYKQYLLKPEDLRLQSVYQGFSHINETRTLRRDTNIGQTLLYNVLVNGDTVFLERAGASTYIYHNPYNTITTYFCEDVAVVDIEVHGNHYYERSLAYGLLELLGDPEILFGPETGKDLIPGAQFLTFLSRGRQHDSTWGCYPNETKYVRLSCPIPPAREGTSFNEYIELVEYLSTYTLGPDVHMEVDFSLVNILKIKTPKMKKFINSKAKKNLELERLLKDLKKIYDPRLSRFDATTRSPLSIPGILKDYEQKYGTAEECIESIKYIKKNRN